jgi:hypothetical protein
LKSEIFLGGSFPCPLLIGNADVDSFCILVYYPRN